MAGSFKSIRVGRLMDGWHSLIARQIDAFDDPMEDGVRLRVGGVTIARKIALCFAPIIQHMPSHQEMYRNLCSDASRKSIERWWNETEADPAVAPGGFAEGVFSDAADPTVEYSYIKDRTGFLRICIENGKDIVPIYTFRATQMYYNIPWLRGLRARLSQKIFVGLVMPFGWMGTSMPLTDKTTTVVFPPFPASSYTVGQLGEAHAAYLVHLRYQFDLHKGSYGMRDTELQFVGKDFVDNDVVARTLRVVGVLPPVPRSRL